MSGDIFCIYVNVKYCFVTEAVECTQAYNMYNFVNIQTSSELVV